MGYALRKLAKEKEIWTMFEKGFSVTRNFVTTTNKSTSQVISHQATSPVSGFYLEEIKEINRQIKENSN